MPLYELTHNELRALPRTTMQEQAFRERQDLQRLIKDYFSILEPDLLLLAEEFSHWEDSRRRIDLLAVDRLGTLVVIELKRTEDGGHMELQALRYAAMVSTLTLNQAAKAYASTCNTDPGEAQAAILDYIGSAAEDFARKVRIILVSPDFSRELTTSVLWLIKSGLDMRCVRLRPYKLENRTLIEVDQIIPLREAQDYTVRLKEKEEEVRRAGESNIDFTRYDLTVSGRLYPNLTKRELAWQVVSNAVAAGLRLETLQTVIPPRRLVVVQGNLSGAEFFAAAEAERKVTGYVFQPTRLFMEDDRLIRSDGHTLALSNQWGLPKLPLLEQVIRAIPEARIAYRRVAEAPSEE